MMKRLYEKIFLVCLMVLSCFSPTWNAEAELIERIVAAVNDNVILLSEFKVAIRQAEEAAEEVKEEEIINEMINNLLLLEEAKKFSFGRYGRDAESTEQSWIIKNYIDKRIKALIYVPFRDIEAYYFNNLEKYGERNLYDVKSEIEEYLLNRSLKNKIQEHIDELREEARIRIQLN